ncbi:hypothetical protein CXX84_04105 [Arthrobacter sp. AFG7.2]|nr:hypothetical protein CXX84_04105 [Arthrobacter sp. AFG7.2]
MGPLLAVICSWLVVNLFRDLSLNVSGYRRILLFISSHRPSLSCTRFVAAGHKTDGHPHPGGRQS